MIINVIQTQRQPKPEFTIENIVEKVHMGEAIAHSYKSTYANIENKRYDFDSTRYPAVNNKGICKSIEYLYCKFHSTKLIKRKVLYAYKIC